MRGTYSRWTTQEAAGVMAVFRADWVGARFDVRAVQTTGTVLVTMPDDATHELTADECRMLAVRMIEAGALADTDAIRRVAE